MVVDPPGSGYGKRGGGFAHLLSLSLFSHQRGGRRLNGFIYLLGVSIYIVDMIVDSIFI